MACAVAHKICRLFANAGAGVLLHTEVTFPAPEYFSLPMNYAIVQVKNDDEDTY